MQFSEVFNTGRIFEEKLRELLEKFRELTTVGNEEMGIPVMDPYEKEYFLAIVSIPQTAM